MSDEPRIERFRNELAELKTATSRGTSEQLLLVLSIVLMVAGIVVAFGAFMTSHQSSADAVGQANQRDMIVLAVAGVACAVVGSALFLRYSFAKFLRFWMLRQIYENRPAESNGVAGPDGSRNGPRSSLTDVR
jgi:hypothetical protein